jgi:hypothetical protein
MIFHVPTAMGMQNASFARQRHIACSVTTKAEENAAFIFNLLTYLLTYSMEHSPSLEPNWSAASQEIPRILWKPKVHHRTHKRTPPFPILS